MEDAISKSGDTVTFRGGAVDILWSYESFFGADVVFLGCDVTRLEAATAFLGTDVSFL